MAKELPYFKFEPNQWENGNIQICNREDKGLFIDLCSMYWSRLGDLPIKLAVQRLCNGNATAFNSLIEENIFKVIDGQICIDFLNEQLIEFENLSTTNSENARLGWEKRRKNATALGSQSDGNAIREDKSKEDKIKEKPFSPLDYLISYGASIDLIKSWFEVRKKKKGVNSEIAMQGFIREVEKSKQDINAVLKKCIEKSWVGFEAEWVKGQNLSKIDSERKVLRLPKEYENYMGMELGLLLSRVKTQKGIEYIPDITKAQYDSLPRDSFNMYESLIKSGNCKIIEE